MHENLSNFCKGDLQIKIGVIINKEAAIEDYLKHARQLNCECIFRVSALTAAIDVAKELQDQCHVDAIITMMATSKVLQGHLTVPVVSMDLRGYDVLCALWKAREMGNRLGFVEIETETVLYDFDEIVRLLGQDVRCYQFKGLDRISEVWREIQRDRCDIVVSMGMKTIEALKDYGVQTLLFSPSVESFLNAVREAWRICEVRQEEIEKNRWLGAIVNENDHGILTWDRQGNVVLLNHQAEKILHLGSLQVIGHKVEDLRSQIPLLNQALDSRDAYSVVQTEGMEYLVSSQKLMLDDKTLGGIIQITDVRNIETMELHARRSKSENGFIATTHFVDIQGHTPGIEHAKQLAKKYANSNASVLITGESGSGKELFAQSIHNYSQRWTEPFVAVNCSSLTDSLLESELFGYEEGAFTGAKKKGNPGLFELAHGGTLFMDEVGEMPLYMQTKLLRVLQERTVRRIGGNRSISLDIKFVFATNRNLAKEVKQGHFRADLYYRINVLPLHIPPLRERKEDIPLIAQSMCKEILQTMVLGEGGYSLQAENLMLLMDYEWPGNVRELRNFVEWMIVLGISEEKEIRNALEELKSGSLEEPSAESIDEEHIMVPVGNLRDMNSEIIRQLSDRFGGDRQKLGETLQLSRTTLWRYLKEFES